MQLPRRLRLINALAARAISHSLVEISAMMAAPNGQNGKGKFVFAITKMSAFIGLFRHFSSIGGSAGYSRVKPAETQKVPRAAVCRAPWTADNRLSAPTEPRSYDFALDGGTPAIALGGR